MGWGFFAKISDIFSKNNKKSPKNSRNSESEFN
jgi:hypothetical protein